MTGDMIETQTEWKKILVLYSCGMSQFHFSFVHSVCSFHLNIPHFLVGIIVIYTV